MALPFKVKTKKISLEPYGGEGEIEVRGLSTGTSKKIAEITEKYKNENGDNQVANIETSIAICADCIIKAPFDITEENILEFPPNLLAEIIKAVMEMEDNNLPLA